MKEFNKIGNPLFVFSVFVLVLNDWCLKILFHNNLTGKLSDFAGLFAFPFLLSLVFTNNKRAVHILSGLLFIFWNTEISQPLISYLRSYGLPVNRTIDITDNIALVSIFISYLSHKYSFGYLKLKPLFRVFLICISCIAFMATTLPPRQNRKFVDINKEYEFSISKRELVSRLNTIQLNEIKNLKHMDFDSKKNVFHYYNSVDTLALILDFDKISDKDTIMLKTSFSEILISGDELNSKLRLISIYKVVPVFKEKDYKMKAIKQFEKHIVKQIRKY